MGSLQFWKPGTSGPGSLLDRESKDDESIVPSAAASSYLSIQAQRHRLAIFKHRDQILYCVENYQVTIVVAETGCGKTTQIPQFLYEAGWASDGNVIACTQPRRVAATSVATRVATEVGTELGDEVGYTVRFEDVSNKGRTRICYMTDGMLFREALTDPLLSRYSVIMVDEAHERSVYTDLLLAILKKICQRRPALRLIISSATLDATVMQDYFASNVSPDAATTISLEGRTYPVQVAYLQEATPNYVEKIPSLIEEIHVKQGPGDILVFLTGREEIDQCMEALLDLLPKLSKSRYQLVPLPLHSGLSMLEQMKIFEPTAPGMRKAIIATNIAETSVTIDGIKFVIDCGHVKIRTFDSSSGISLLSIVPISQASATQRAGRAGRTSHGICYRLYPESAFKTLHQLSAPEVVHTDLALPILHLKALGIDNLMKLEWLTIPPSANIAYALDVLTESKIIDSDGHLTQMGRKVAELPTDIKVASMLFNSEEYKCGEEILTIAAMVAIQNVFITPGHNDTLIELEHRKFTAEEGDHLTLLNAFNAFNKYGKSSSWCKSHGLNFRALSRAISIRSQLKRYMERFKLPIQSCEGDAKRIQQCIAKSFWQNIVRWKGDGTYQLLRGEKILHVHPNSVLFTRKPRSGWVVFHEIEEGRQLQISVLTEVQTEELTNMFVS